MDEKTKEARLDVISRLKDLAKTYCSDRSTLALEIEMFERELEHAQTRLRMAVSRLGLLDVQSSLTALKLYDMGVRPGSYENE